ncbi:MAG: methyltransferase domain-containing protein [Chloroflexi bacterium]|nr:methyltransferase domain-containing protein [Chloroflexota bacterium]
MSISGLHSSRNLMRQHTGPQPPRLLRPLFNQFAQPSGLLGQLAGRLMSKTDADDRWIVELLDVQPGDRVLDVGCGPGVTVELIAERATVGLVCGIDPSVVMLRQAARRSADAVRAGRVELRRGEVSALPYSDGQFTKACAVHSLYFWPSVESGLRELHRVLGQDGLLMLAVRMRRQHAGVFDPSRYGYTDAQIDEATAALGSVGFRDVSVQHREIGRETITAIMARR